MVATIATIAVAALTQAQARHEIHHAAPKPNRVTWCNRWTRSRIDCGVEVGHWESASFAQFPDVGFDPTALNRALSNFPPQFVIDCVGVAVDQNHRVRLTDVSCL